MNKFLGSIVVFPAAIACLQAPTQSVARGVTPAAQAGCAIPHKYSAAANGLAANSAPEPPRTADVSHSKDDD
jgi:hypothetical protein